MRASPTIVTLAAAALALASATPTLPAQRAGSGSAPPAAPATEPLALSGDARPGMFISAVGRRSIAMGTEDGRLEMWTWPIKWMHDFALAFRVPKYTEAIPGREVARRVETTPGGVTITYAYESFTVRQRIFAPLDQPAVVMLLDVDAIRPMEIVGSFTPDVHYAWPAALGGQYLEWSQDDHAFLFSESRRKVNAFFGSPAITQASDVPAHMFGAAPPQFVIGVGADSERYTAPKLGEPPGKLVNIHETSIPIVLVGGEIPRDSARALYRALIAPGAAERAWRRVVAHDDSLRATTLALHSPDSLLDRAVSWAEVNLDEAFVCNPDLGCGLVAGYGLSGAASDRPGFGWFFGGDAAINSFAMDGAGESPLVRDGVFRFFAKYQRKDGKIPHEISQGAGKVDWFGAYPYAFYHGDTTPFWILAFGEYWRQTADTSLVRELWPNLKKAFDWSRATDADGDGLMDNPKAGAGALEVGDLQAGIVSDIYLSGVWIASLDRFARMADAVHDSTDAALARRIRERATRTLESKLWLPGARQYAFALLDGGKVNDALTAWPATAMAFDDMDRDRGAAMAARLAGASIMTDWGARPLSSTSALFDPLHYNNGAVWPFVTGWVSLAEYRYHNAPAGEFALDAIARTGFDEARGRNPEVISGTLYKPLDTAVPQQFFATSMVLTPLIRGMLGIDVDAPAGRVILAPHLPPDWDSVRVDNIPVGADRLDFAMRRDDATHVSASVVRHGPASTKLAVVFAPALPIGATHVAAAAMVGSAMALRGDATAERTPGDVHAAVEATLGDSATFSVRFQGGWTVVPPRHRPAIGDRSTEARVVSERMGDAGGGAQEYILSLEGRAGASYDFRLRAPDGASLARVAAPERGARRASGGGSADLGAAGADGWRVLRVTFPPRADADGYAALELTFRSTTPAR